MPRMRSLIVGIVAVAALGLTACSANDLEAQDDNSQTLSGSVQTQIDEAVANAMQWSGSTQAVIGVWTGSGDYVRGYASEGASDVDANTLFRGAQVTQPALCALLLDMVDSGELSLD